jgi:heterodisulfide reductase subunit B
MKVGYYPGCSLEATGRPYNHSTREVCGILGVDLEEPSDWSCCGSSPALKMDRLLSVSLAAHNLALAEKQGASDVLIPCPFCYRRLLSAQEEINADAKLKAKVESTIEADLKGRLQIRNILDLFHSRVGMDAIRAGVRKPLDGLKVVPYYGCYLVKPPGVTHFDDPEDPVSMDEILSVLGAKVLDWDFKAECCGSGLSLSKTEKVVELSGRLIREAVHKGADAMVVVCQLCHANLDMRQKEIGRLHGRKYELPIVYLTQLMGLAFGVASKQLEMGRHIVSSRRFLRRLK